MSSDDPLTEREEAFRRVLYAQDRKRWRLWCAHVLKLWRQNNPGIKPDPWTLARGKRKVVKVPDKA